MSAHKPMAPENSRRQRLLLHGLDLLVQHHHLPAPAVAGARPEEVDGEDLGLASGGAGAGAAVDRRRAQRLDEASSRASGRGAELFLRPTEQNAELDAGAGAGQAGQQHPLGPSTAGPCGRSSRSIGARSRSSAGSRADVAGGAVRRRQARRGVFRQKSRCSWRHGAVRQRHINREHCGPAPGRLHVEAGSGVLQQPGHAAQF